MSIWRDPKKTLPMDGAIVAAMHRPCIGKALPASLEIMFGMVEWSNDKTLCRVQSGDATGKGLWAVYLKGEADWRHEDVGIAWAYVEDLQLPEWIR